MTHPSDKPKYAPGGIVRAPCDDNVVGEWFISNEGASWFVISRGATHRIATVEQLDIWQAYAKGEKIEDVEEALAFDSPLTIEPSPGAIEKVWDALAAVWFVIKDNFVDIVFVIALAACVVVAASSMTNVCAS